MRQFIQRARYLPPPGTTRTFPNRWAFIWSNARRFIRGARLLGSSVKNGRSPTAAYIFAQTCAKLFSCPDILRSLEKRERSPAAGNLIGRTCADLSAAPDCLVSPAKNERPPTDTYIFDQACAHVFHRADIFRPLITREQYPAAGH